MTTNQKIIAELERRLKQVFYPTIPIMRGYDDAEIVLPGIYIIEGTSRTVGDIQSGGSYEKILPIHIEFYASTLTREKGNGMPIANIAIANIRSAIELDRNFAIDNNSNKPEKWLCHTYKELSSFANIRHGNAIEVAIEYEFLFAEQHLGYLEVETTRTLNTINNLISLEKESLVDIEFKET